MAKQILWSIVALGFLFAILFHLMGDDVGAFTKIVILSALAVLSLCESIEKSKK